MVGCAPVSSSARSHQSRPHREPVTGHSAQHRPEAPQLKRLGSGRYRVRKPWTVMLNGHSWQVSAGYTTNGITGPAWLKNSLGDGVNFPETWAAVFHDWLFTQPGISRNQADQLFHDLLIGYDVSPLKARLMHSSVAAYSASKSHR